MPWVEAMHEQIPGVELFDAHTHLGQNDPDGMKQKPEELLEGLRARGLSWMDWGDILQLSRQILERKVPVEFNDETWGLGEMPLRETIHSSLVSMPFSANCAARS